MILNKSSLQLFKDSLTSTCNTLSLLIDNIKDDFISVIEMLDRCNGHIIVTGHGKSGIIGKKFVSTLNSISIPAIFLSANDASHGDLGVITSKDVVIILSKSGDDRSLVDLAKSIKIKQANSILLTSNPKAKVGQHTNLKAIIYVDKEGDDFNLIPSNSSVCYLAVCDSIALTLLKLNNRSKDDFGINHPGGSIGKFHFTSIQEVIRGKNPHVTLETGIKEIITSISEGRKGATVILDGMTIVGIITDGDLRRMLENSKNIFSLTAKDIMTHDPISILETLRLNEALDLMKTNTITQVIVTNDKGAYTGILHMHDLISMGF